MTTATFAEDSRVAPIDRERWRAQLSDRWDVPDGPPNGGYVLAVAARAMAAAVERPDPVSVTAHYLAPADHGPAEVAVQPVRTGGRHATATAMLRSNGTGVACLLGTFTDLTRARGATLLHRGPPELPDPQDCVASGPPGAGIGARFDYRVREQDVGWTRGEPTGEGEYRAWIRFADGAPVDPFGLLVVADAFAPAVFDLGLPVGWVPTIELTVHVRRRPAAGWLRCRVHTRFVTEGYLEEDTEVWDADDRLVALSRQLALAPRPA